RGRALAHDHLAHELGGQEREAHAATDKSDLVEHEPVARGDRVAVDQRLREARVGAAHAHAVVLVEASGAARLRADGDAGHALDPAGSQPLYQQLQRALREAIERRLLAPDDALPPERQIAAELSVSRITVRKALDGLVEEGLLVRRQGSGNFVASRIEKNFAKLTSFSEDMRSRGRTPRSVWLKRSAGEVTPEEALTLRLSPGAPVYRFHRLRYADEAPMC